jgi:hypothetical protein
MTTTMTIWKVVLEITDVQDIEIPKGAVLLTVREQHDQLCIWYKCDPSRPKAKYRILARGTDHRVPEDARYAGTGHLFGGNLVLQVFEAAGQ